MIDKSCRGCGENPEFTERCACGTYVCAYVADFSECRLPHLFCEAKRVLRRIRARLTRP